MGNYKTGVIVSGDASGAVRSLKLTRGELEKLNGSKKRGTAAAKKYSSSVGKMSALLKVAVPAVTVTMFANLAKTTFDAADRIGELSERIGASTEALSEYRHIAELSGVQFDQLATAWQRQTRRIAEAAKGSGEAKDAIKELGLEAKSLVELRPEDQFEAIARAMEGVSIQGDKVRLGMKFWDSEGVSMLQTISGGADQLKRWREEAKQLGRSLSEEQVAAADAANDAWTRLRASARGLTDQMVLGLAPGVAHVIEKFNELSRQSNVFAALGGVVNEAFKVMLHGVPVELSATEKEVVKLKETIRDMGPAIDAVNKVLDQLKQQGQEGTPAWKAYSDQLTKYKKVVTDAEKQITKLTKKTEVSTKATKTNTVETDKNKKSKKEQQDAIEELIFSIDKEAKATHEFMANYEQLHQAVMAGNLDFEYAIELTEKMATGQRDAADSADKLKNKTREVSVELSAFAQAANDTGRELDSAFLNLWKNLDDGFGEFADNAIDSFKSMLAEMAHQATTRPILVSMGLVNNGQAGAGSTINYNSATGEYDSSGLVSQMGGMAASGGSGGFLDTPYLGTTAGGAIGVAGMLGGLGAGAIYDGEHAATGGAIGASAGMAIASAASLAGPYGVALAAIGALLGGALGDRMSNSGMEATYFNSADGLAPVARGIVYEDRDGGWSQSILDRRFQGWEDGSVYADGAFGRLGLLSHGTSGVDEDLFKDAIDNIVAVDNAISDAFGDEATARVREALDGWREQDNQADDFEERMQARFNVILENLDFQYSEIARMGTISLEQMTERLFLLKEIEDFVESNPLDGYTDLLAESQKTLRDRLNESTSAVARLGGELITFSASTESLERFAEGIRERYQLELQYLNQIRTIQEGLNSSIQSSIENIQLSVMTSEQQYDYFSEQAESLAATIGTITDPTEINDVVNRINELTNRAYGTLESDGQRQEVSGEFVEFLEAVMEQANSQLDSARSEAVSESEALRERLALAIEEGGEALRRHLELAGNDFRDAAWDIHQAAYVWANNTDVRVTVDVNLDQALYNSSWHDEAGYA